MAPVVGVISVVGTLAALVGLGGEVGSVVAQVLLRATSPELWWMVTVARELGGLSWAAIEIPDGLAGMALVMTFTILGAALINRRVIGWARRRLRSRRGEARDR